jgi:Family of unknown function (DUF5715)
VPPALRSRTHRARLRIATVIVAVLLAAAGIAGIAGLGDPTPGGVPTVAPGPGGEDDQGLPDPFAWDPEREDEFVRRAATGTSHLLYTLSPGGAAASAERVARWREPIEAAAREAGVDPDTLEGLVFLESAGRDDAITPNGLEGAVGLTQILAGTATDLLGMRVDTDAARRLGRRIDRALARGREDQARRLRAERARVDERFDGAKALAGTARYLKLARDTFGREDLAFVSYHMGIGNLEGVLRAFSGRTDGKIAEVVDDEELGWPEVYFDSTFARHADAYGRLIRLGDDSSNYFWKVLAGREIMRLYRDDPAELARLTALHEAKGSAEEVLHPPGSVPQFADPAQLRAAWDDGQIVALPDTPRVTGLRRDERMGELARRLGQPAGLYRGLRPEALAMALYVGAQVRALSGASPLIVTSTVRDERYQRELVERNREATRNFSLHTTGWAFDVERRYVSRRQALAFQNVLDRLSVLGGITWVREPDAIHITVSSEAEALLPLLDRIEPSP